MKNCPKCGSLLGDSAQGCPACAESQAEQAPLPRPAEAAAAVAARLPPNALEAAVASFLFSGAGQLKTGQKLKALLLLPVSANFYFFSFLLTMSLADTEGAGPGAGRTLLLIYAALTAAWVYGVVDAYAAARRLAGFKPDIGAALILAAGCMLFANKFGSSLGRSLNHKRNFSLPAFNGARLGQLRSALSIYYGDTTGAYPSRLEALTAGDKYLSAIPAARGVANHPDSSQVRHGATSDDSGGWLYNDVPGDANIGGVLINCTHTDTRGEGKLWSTY
jgi:hypothetical protein